jgi:hypothetical protein
MRVCPVMAVNAVVTLGAGRCLDSCFYLCLIMQRSTFRDGFGMFCLFRAALLSAFPGGVLAWDGFSNKKGICCVEGFRLVCSSLSCPFSKLCSVCLLILSHDGRKNVVDVLAHLILGYI